MKEYNKFIVLLAVTAGLAGCGSIPLAPQSLPAANPADTADTADAGGSGLGTVTYDKQTRAEPCEKMRKTGSLLYITKCDDPDGGSQPVRYGTWNDLGRYAMSGTVRPENN